MKPVPPQRNRLVWLNAGGWRAVRSGTWDDAACELLAHWQARGLPLVVARRRSGAAGLSLGLPAPNRWSRRRLALQAPAGNVCATGSFPTLLEAALGLQWGAAAVALAQRLAGCGVTARVYGSHGWELLSGEPCTVATSDIDLSLEAAGPDAARAALAVLRPARLHRRLDGEFVFPGGAALAWREFEQACDGRVGRVLLKDDAGAQLVDFGAWCQAARAA